MLYRFLRSSSSSIPVSLCIAVFSSVVQEFLIVLSTSFWGIRSLQTHQPGGSVHPQGPFSHHNTYVHGGLNLLGFQEEHSLGGWISTEV